MERHSELSCAELVNMLARKNRADYRRQGTRIEWLTPKRVARVFGMRMESCEQMELILKELGGLCDHAKILIEKDKRHCLLLEPYHVDIECIIDFCDKYDVVCRIGEYPAIHAPGLTTPIVLYKRQNTE